MRGRLKAVGLLIVLIIASLFPQGHAIAAWRWVEITGSVGVWQGSFNTDTTKNVYYQLSHITNSGSVALTGQVRFAVLTSMTAVSNADGTTADGKPFRYLSSSSSYSLAPSATSADVRIEFQKPKKAPTSFYCTLRIERYIDDSLLDDDNDGVVNASDVCPSTPAGYPVNSSGCAWVQLDDDGDGVVNGSDSCIGTPAGSQVNSSGCAFGETNLGIMIVSKSSAGVQGNGNCQFSALSADGRYVAYDSYASNLVSGDTNAKSDVFVTDVFTGTTERVSITTASAQANDSSINPSISDDGKMVAFTTYATNFVSQDRNNATDVILRNRNTNQSKLLSRNATGGPGASASSNAAVSNDGRYVAFMTYSSDVAAMSGSPTPRVILYDVQTDALEQASLNAAGAPVDGYYPKISGDGRYVAFTSPSALVAGDTNGKFDVYVKDRQTGSLTRASFYPWGSQFSYDCSLGWISSDGRYTTFSCFFVSNKVIYIRDMVAGTTSLISNTYNGLSETGFSDSPDVSDNGRFVAFSSSSTNIVPNDSNGSYDIFLKDSESQQTTAISRDANGNSTYGLNSQNPVISASGRFIAFSSAQTLIPSDANAGAADIYMIDVWKGPYLDTDKDGVGDDNDNCPNTPIGEQADAYGCSASQRDTDLDGVFDNHDTCPSTVLGSSVDANGCAWAQRDDDGDGVLNPADVCPSTPIGEPSDANGCAWSQRDDDGDGLNNQDEATKYGTNPNLTDSDGDGLSDNAELSFWGAAWNLDLDQDGLTNLIDQDSDGDGMLDGYETLNNFDPAVRDGMSDEDNDGYSDVVETKIGTSLANATSTPVITIDYSYNVRNELTTSSGLVDSSTP